MTLELLTLGTRTRQLRSFVCERNVQNFPIHVIRALYIDVSSYLTLTIQASSRLKRSANHLWNNSDVCRKKFGEYKVELHWKCSRTFSCTRFQNGVPFRFFFHNNFWVKGCWLLSCQLKLCYSLSTKNGNIYYQ
jgi:hypothetical protein